MVVFEGPEKRLSVTFDSITGSGGSVRDLPQNAVRDILDAASCTVLSVCSTPHVDAYLLSESSLFITERAVMLKTCGATTLLRALPVILEAVRNIGLHSTGVQYSRVAFQNPDEQPWPHDSYANEVSYLDSALGPVGAGDAVPDTDSGARGCSLPLHLGHTDWHAYVHRAGNGIDMEKQHTLEVFMFDLDRKCMAQFMNGDEDAMETTIKSGIGGLVGDSALIDAHNFSPCGYSMNSVDGDSYVTIHVSPEPEASYVSFEFTSDIALLADKVAKVVKTFKPSRFTVSFVGTDDCSAMVASPKAPINWVKMCKLLRGSFSCTGSPVLLQASPGLWAAVATYKEIPQGIPKVMSNTSSTSNSIAATTAKKPDIVQRALADFALHPAPRESVAKALVAISNLEDPSEQPVVLLDVHELRHRAEWLRAALPDNVSARYAVRCNSDRAVLAVLNALKWTFEAVSISEIRALLDLGVDRVRIVFSSPCVSRSVLNVLGKIGTIVLFGVPSEKLALAVKEAGCRVELRIPCDTVEDAVETYHQVLDTVGRIDSFALDVEPNVYAMDRAELASELDKGLNHISSVCSASDVVDGIIVHAGELFPGVEDIACLDLNFLGALFNSHLLGDGEARNTPVEKLIIDPSRWILGPCSGVIVSIIGMRVRDVESSPDVVYHYYMNDGVYGSFNRVIMGRGREHEVTPEVIGKNCTSVDGDVDDSRSVESMELVQSTLFGPTCDALDKVWEGALPKLNVGDLLLFDNMGAYAVSAVSSFNGFAKQFRTVYITSGKCALVPGESVDSFSEHGSE